MNRRDGVVEAAATPISVVAAAAVAAALVALAAAAMVVADSLAAAVASVVVSEAGAMVEAVSHRSRDLIIPCSFPSPRRLRCASSSTAEQLVVS